MCIDFLLLRNKSVYQKIGENFGSLSISTITVAELRVGSKMSDNPDEDDRKLDMFMSAVAVEQFSTGAAEKYGEVVRAVGVERRSFDRLLAAHAIALEYSLVTNNERDFRCIPHLQVENWAAR